MFHLGMARRFAIITYDPDVVAKLSPLEVAGAFSYSLWRGLNGYTYAKERGILNVTIMIQQPAVPAPSDERRLAQSLDANGAATSGLPHAQQRQVRKPPL
jgi:hypothetical protein